MTSNGAPTHQREPVRNRPDGMMFGVLAFGALAVGIVFAGLALVSAQPDNDSNTDEASTERTVAEATAQIDSLSEEVKINGVVGYGDSFRLPVEAQGIVTWSPEEGAILGHGDTVVKVDQRPVLILRSPIPLYRELRLIGSGERDTAGTKLGLMKGSDVETLQKYLLEQGFDDKGRLEADGTFGAATKRAVKAWQAEVAHPATGRIDRSQMVFLTSDIRVDSSPKVGLAFDAVVATQPATTVTATVTAKQKGFFGVGSSVRLDADGTDLTGTVSELKRESGADGSTQLSVHIEVSGLPTGVEAVKVTATKTVVEDQVTIPVTALVALVDGGWAVEVITPQGSELKAVELVDVVGTRAAVTGIAEGTRVVVPS